MTDPVLVEVTRGGRVESAHRGAVAVVDGDGAMVLEIGDAQRPVFPRSAVKAIQALPLVESGAADDLGFGDKELALACASHSGEPEHVALAASMLARAGLDDRALECGPHCPTRQEVALAMARRGESPTQLHNNCSGKHAGFVCACRHIGVQPAGYVGIDHAYQRMIAETMTEVTGAAHGHDNAGVDGCSIPTYATPLTTLAHGFARMATGQGLSPGRATAARRLLDACMAEPFYVAGTDRADTRIMHAGAGRVFVKTGAEGVYCAAIPELGFGVALKCDDGAGRAAESAIAAVLARLLGDDGLRLRLAEMARVPLINWRGVGVGEVRPAGALN